VSADGRLFFISSVSPLPKSAAAGRRPPASHISYQLLRNRRAGVFKKEISDAGSAELPEEKDRARACGLDMIGQS
jgi:hypothetical protein